MEEEIELRVYLNIIKKKFHIILLITTIVMIISGVISFFLISPIYESTTTLIVNSDENKTENTMLTNDQITATQKIALTYAEIIKSRLVLEKVIKNLKLDMTYKDISKNISVSTVNETQIMELKVEDTNPQRAKDIANSIIPIFSDEAKRVTEANGVEVIDKAIAEKDPIKPNKVINIIIAAVLGIMISLSIVFLLEYLDTKVKTPEDIEKYLGLPLLGTVPMENK